MPIQYQVNNTNSQGVIKKLIQDYTEDDLYIAIPATVMNTDDYETMQVVSVKPCIDLIFTEHNDVEVKANVIKKVFVKLPAAGGFAITWPISVGDLVTLQWSHRDLGDFLDGSGDDISQSKHDVANIEDCWVEVGFGTRKNNQSPSATNFVLKSDATTITITPSGKVDIVTTDESSLTSSGHTITAPLTLSGDFTSTGTTSVTGASTFTGATSVVGNLDYTTLSTSGVSGVSGVFTSQYGSITILNGIITAIA